jgi:DNA invertase Pin-like site-specific DNA recombinase
VVRAAGFVDRGGWSVVYPRSTRPAGGDEVLLSPDPASEPARGPASGVGVLIGYARCSTDKQDLAAQRHTLHDLGVSDDRVYLDHGMTGRNRNRPGLQQALAAVRAGDTLVVPKLDRLARSVPDAGAIGDALTIAGVRLSIGGTVYDPSDPMGKMFFNTLATFAEFEVDLLRIRSRPAADADPRRNGDRSRERQAQRQATQAQFPPARPRPQTRCGRRPHDCRAR